MEQHVRMGKSEAMKPPTGCLRLKIEMQRIEAAGGAAETHPYARYSAEGRFEICTAEGGAQTLVETGQFTAVTDDSARLDPIDREQGAKGRTKMERLRIQSEHVVRGSSSAGSGTARGKPTPLKMRCGGALLQLSFDM